MTDSTEITIPPQGRELMDSLDIRFSDPSDLALAIAQRLALSQTPDELFTENGSNGWEGHEGEAFLIRRVYWLPSTYPQGLGFYAVVEAADAKTGELSVLTTGSTNVMIQLAKAQQMGWLDEPVKLKKPDAATGAGYYPHRLVRA